MNGPPANPISGTVSSSASNRTASTTYGVSTSGSSGRRRCRSRRPANGSATTGPVPGATSTPKPMAAAGTTMSEKKIAASVP